MLLVISGEVQAALDNSTSTQIGLDHIYSPFVEARLLTGDVLGREITHNRPNGRDVIPGRNKGVALRGSLALNAEEEGKTLIMYFDDEENASYSRAFPKAGVISLYGKSETVEEMRGEWEANGGLFEEFDEAAATNIVEGACLKPWDAKVKNAESYNQMLQEVQGGRPFGFCPSSALLHIIKMGKGNTISQEIITAMGCKDVNELGRKTAAAMGVAAPQRVENIYDTVDPSAVATHSPLYGNASAIEEQKAIQAQRAATAPATLRRAQSAPGDDRPATPPARAASAPPTSPANTTTKESQAATSKLSVAPKVDEMLKVYKKDVDEANKRATDPIKGFFKNLRNAITLNGVRRGLIREANKSKTQAKMELIYSVANLTKDLKYDMESFNQSKPNTNTPHMNLSNALSQGSKEDQALGRVVEEAIKKQEKSPKAAWPEEKAPVLDISGTKPTAVFSLPGASDAETSVDPADEEVPALPLKVLLQQRLSELAESNPSVVQMAIRKDSKGLITRESFSIVGGITLKGAGNNGSSIDIESISFNNTEVQFITKDEQIIVGAEGYLQKAFKAVGEIAKGQIEVGEEHPFSVGGSKGSVDSGFKGSADSVLDMVTSPDFAKNGGKFLNENKSQKKSFYLLDLSGDGEEKESVVIRIISGEISVASAKDALGTGGKLRSDKGMAELDLPPYQSLEGSKYKIAILDLADRMTPESVARSPASSEKSLAATSAVSLGAKM